LAPPVAGKVEAADRRTDLQPIHVAVPLAAPAIAVIRRNLIPLTPAATFLLDLVRKSAPRRV
jgi:hypothetical protein